MAGKSKNSKQKDIHSEIRQLSVLIEDVGGDVKLVAEQHGDIKKEIRGIRQTLNTHTEMIGKIMVDFSIAKEDIEFIKNSFKKKVDVEEFAALERRVALLERHR